MEPLGASDGGGGARDLWYELLQERRGAWRKAASLARAQRTVDADGVAKIDLAAVHTAHRAEELTLPAGSCNLYAFPLVKTSREPRGSHPTAAGLRTLKKIVLALYSQTGCLDCEDQVGAQPVHALAVCNVPEAISLVVDLYRLRPQLMSRVHTSTRTGMPLFLGESVLHILAVNKREAELVQVVGLATRTLPLPDARALFGSVAAGVFFAQRPMLLFGGTALSYAVAFELAGAVHALLSTGLVSLNDRSQACPLSGFLPLHAAVACGSTSMYDLLTMELPYELRAREGLLTSKARHPEYHGLSCIQLAATLGDQDALQHLLKKQCEARWEWGPVIEYALDLDGIDSAGRGGNDIMELIARAGANRATTVLLLDSFMNGFLHALFCQKWRLFGRRLFLARRTLDLTLLVALLVLAIDLKADPEIKPHHVSLVGITIVLVVADIAFEVSNIVLFAINQRETSEGLLPARMLATQTFQWCRMHDVFLLMTAHAIHATACLLLLAADLPTFIDATGGVIEDATPANATDRRALRATGGTGVGSTGGHATTSASGGSLSGSDDLSGPFVDEGLWLLLWIVLALAILLRMWHFIETASRAVEALHILVLAVRKVFQQDILIFMVLYTWQILTALATLFTLYPRSGLREISLFPFNNVLSAGKEVLALALMGDSATVDKALLEPGGAQALWEMVPLQLVGVVLFVCSYIFFVLLSVITLLNLLIAMLTHTFDELLEESTLQSRLQFARSLVRLELVAPYFGMATRVGERVPANSADEHDRYVHVFRALREGQGDDEDDAAEEDEASSLAARMGENFMDVGAATDPFKEVKPTQLTRMEKALNRVLATQALASCELDGTARSPHSSPSSTSHDASPVRGGDTSMVVRRKPSTLGRARQTRMQGLVHSEASLVAVAPRRTPSLQQFESSFKLVP